MTYTPRYSRTDRIHDAIIAQLQAYAQLTGLVPPLNIGRWWDDRGDSGSTGMLQPLTVKVYAVEHPEDPESIGPVLFRYTLGVTVLTAMDYPQLSIPYSIANPHALHEAICGAVEAAWFDKVMTFPDLTELTAIPNRSPSNPTGDWIYEGKEETHETEQWFETHYKWRLDYCRDPNYTPPSTSTATATATTSATTTTTATST